MTGMLIELETRGYEMKLSIRAIALKFFADIIRTSP
jgi:hypothetical protein